MQDGASNGLSQAVHQPQVKVEDRPTTPPSPDDDANLPNGDDNPDHDLPNGSPPPKKRKLADTTNSQRPSPRPVSPPWKRSHAEGPTSFLENGRRKSGRTNLIPLEMQPHSNKRQTRAAFDQVVGQTKTTKPLYNPNQKKPAVASQPKKPDPAPAAAPPKRVAVRTSSRPTSKPENLSSAVPAKKTSTPKKPPSGRKTQSPKTLDRLAELEAQLAKLQKQQARKSGSINGFVKHEFDDSDDDSSLLSSPSERSPTPPLTFKRVNFKVHLPAQTVATPSNKPAEKRFESFEDFLDKDDTEYQLGEDILSPEEVAKEAETRYRVRQAQKPGQLLHRKDLNSLPPSQPEPKKQFTHQDHLLAHVHYFHKLLSEENRSHRRRAQVLAHEAKRFLEAKARKNKVKTQEEIDQEEQDRIRALYKSVVKDVDKMWLAVLAEVEELRLKEYEDQQQAETKRHLERVLDRTNQMLNRDLEDSILDSADITDDESAADSSNESENSEEMSNSGSDSDSNPDEDNQDADLTVEELQKKYGNIPDLEKATPDVDVEITSIAPSTAGDGEEEDSDPETVMDSEFDTEASEEDESAEEESEEEEEGTGGLLGLFFSKKEITQAAEEAGADGEDPSPEEPGQTSPRSPLIQELDHTEDQIDDSIPPQPEDQHDTESSALEPSPIIDQNSESADREQSVERQELHQADPGSDARSSPDSPHTTVTKASAPESVSSFEPHVEAQSTETVDKQVSDIKTPVPSLLRGTLREYQHEGLDWMANLYANGRSGILADEMGLGKTIQSISVLAHLAEVHEVWGPHLIVVPTSVMLNWEMEFKKFLPGFKVLTYYGSIEERKAKRRGWMAEDSFNVCITSYQLVLQDANSFKRRQWHYMILDEAHNIKNFRSERWQTMMTFNTRARLLLTGTPLQNNLTELWSLLFFLHYGQEADGDDDAFAGLKEWSEWFKRPVESILEHNKEVLDDQDKEQVAKLHKVIRPFLLRRLKADVEKQMPRKYEHVEMCRLSKRQRQLYDGFMSRAQTKETLASGNYMSIINALMQLRKVCNHPDLFETRPINTSFAMPKSVAADFEIQDLLVRRKTQKALSERVDLDFLQLVPICNEQISTIEYHETTRKHAFHQIKAIRDKQYRRVPDDLTWHGEERMSILASLENAGRQARLKELDQLLYQEAYRHHEHPVYGRGLIQRLKIATKYDQLANLTGQKIRTRFWQQEQPTESLSLVQSLQRRSDIMEPLVQKYGCITPGVVANDLSALALTEAGAVTVRESYPPQRPDPFHEARMKLSIAFPDKRLLQYDCGKLQRLDKLLRTLQSGGHRALIFTQMTKVLDILEQFLNIHGHRYLRLDGATKVEQRQMLTERFNSDTRILAFILSSRSGGLGINLTGADTVIFYDLDWNPAMDKQCTDRAHRIGQTRDVHIYRFVSEHTIESNILRKANQKQILDDVVIQEGDFTTDYLNRSTYRDMLDDDTTENDVAGAAMDRVLGNDRANVTAFEQAEEKEDTTAAQVAARELQHADEGDFEDKAPQTTETSSKAQTPGPFGATNAALAETEAGTPANQGHIDEYMITLQKWLLRSVPLGPAKDKRNRKGKNRRRDEHRTRRIR